MGRPDCGTQGILLGGSAYCAASLTAAVASSPPNLMLKLLSASQVARLSGSLMLCGSFRISFTNSPCVGTSESPCSCRLNMLLLYRILVRPQESGHSVRVQLIPEPVHRSSVSLAPMSRLPDVFNLGGPKA